MVLYDKNHKFIGISSKTLSYLGYEDIKEFSSVHSDFANILVNQEGYIYNFSNFSWIDFILYSGSPNKSALATLKNGLEVEIKLSIEEIYLPQEINGSNTFFAVHVISEVEIDKEDYEYTAPKGTFNLNNLMQPTETNNAQPQQREASQKIETLNNNSYKLDISQQEIKNEVEDKEFILDTSFQTLQDEKLLDTKQEKEEPIFQPKEEMTPEIKSDNSLEEFKLNFLKKEQEEEPISKPEEEMIPEVKSDDSAKEFKLNFLATEQKQEEELISKPEEEIKPQIQKEKKTEELSLNFLKQKTEKEYSSKQESQITPKVEEKNANEDDSRLNFLKMDKQKETISKPEEKIESSIQKEELSRNFLKQEIEETPLIKEENNSENFKLNFLKTEKQEEPISKPKEEVTSPMQEENKAEEPSLNFLEQKREEASFIQKEHQVMPEVNNSNESDFQLNFLKTEKQEEPISKREVEVKSIIQEESQVTPRIKEKNSDEEDFKLNFLRSTPYKEEEKEIINDEGKHTEREPSTLEVNNNKQEDLVQFNFLQNLNKQETEPAPVTEPPIDIEQKEQLINQIKEDIEEIDTKENISTKSEPINKKFLSTSFKSIFSRGGKGDKKEEVINHFSLKSKNKTPQNRQLLEEESTIVIQQPQEEIKPKLDLDLNKPLIQEGVVTQQQIETVVQPQNIGLQLKNLGLTKEDEYDLINDFVNDISVHLTLFQTLVDNKNFDQAQYSLIKIKSSAEILNLDAIIISLNGIKEACDSQDEVNIKELSIHLENQVQQLRDYLKNANI